MPWYWITEREKPDNPVYDWQSREPVTPEAKQMIVGAWRAYDNSDASFDKITHEEAVLARYAAESCRILYQALESIADFAPGNGDVCEIIARRARKALAEYLRQGEAE